MKPIALLSLPALLAALTLVGCADESPERRIASAKTYLQKSDNKSAIIEIKNVLQKYPDSGEARFLLGSTLLKEGNPVAAEVELRKALAAKYPDAHVVPELARAMLMLGQAKKVVDEFALARLGTPTADARLQTELAAAYGALGKADQAQAALTAALMADPKYARALLVNARQRAAARDINGAMAVVDDVLIREPGNADAWKLKGDILLYASNQPAEALAAYHKTLTIEPKYLPAHVAILTLLMQQGNLDEATKQMEELKKFAAKNPQARYIEAQLAFQKKDFKAAQALVQGLLQQAPNTPRLLELAGAVELQLGAAAQAQIYLTKALQVAPALPLARRLLIMSYLRSGQPANALIELNAAIGKDGVPPALLALAGEVHLQNGDAKKAEVYFAKALELDPEDARKRTALAVTHLAGGKGDTAVDELQNIASSDSGVTADLALISVHMRNKDLAKALAAIDKLEAKQPDRPLAANLRGRVQLAQKDTAAARRSFERALSIDPNYFAAAASLAALDVADKNPDDAKKRFEPLLAKNPKNGQALMALAQLAASQGAAKGEIAGLLAKAIDANPTEVAPRMLLIEFYLRNKDNKEALATSQSAVAAVPNSPELLTALGRVQQVSGDVNQAIATYSQLAAMQPLSPVPHVRLAEAYVVNKDYKAAQQSLRKALEIKPDFLDAQRGLIMLALQARQYPDALKVARTMQAQTPNAPIGYLFEGDIAVAQKNLDQALAAYRNGLRHNTSSTELATKLHTVLRLSGKAEDAGKFAATWTKEHPKDGAFLIYLGDIAIAQKNLGVAEKNYLAAIEIQPNSPVALNNLAWVSGQLKRDGAIAYAEKANKLAPNQPALMDTLAMLLAEQNESARSIALLNSALGLQPANAGLRLNLAKVYIKAGDKTRAKAELDALAKLGDKFAAQPEVATLLKEL